MTIQDLYQVYMQYPSVQTDTRKIKQGDIFFALSGPNFNGNNFALTALEKGAAYAIVDEDIQGADNRIIRVEDTLITLQELAKYHRKQFTIPDNKRGFAKQVLGGKIVSLFKEDKNFTHIKFQKLQYLAEHLAEEDLLWNYYRQQAGPYDNKFMHNVANRLKENKWFEEKKYKFYPLQKVNDIERFYGNYFGGKHEKLSELFSLLKNASEKLCEAIATIYAVWNNHIILKQGFDKDKIKTEFFEWSTRKENVFTEKEFEQALAWMQKHNIVPNGFGKLIKQKVSK